MPPYLRVRVARSSRSQLNPADLVFPGNSSVRVQDVEPRRVAVELDPIAQRFVTHEGYEIAREFYGESPPPL